MRKQFVNIYLVEFGKPLNKVQVYGTLDASEHSNPKKEFQKIRNSFITKPEFSVQLQTFSAIEKYGYLVDINHV